MCDVVFITNNMVTLVERSPCYRLVLVTNRFFGHKLVEDRTLAHNVSAVLCNYGPTCQSIHASGVHNRTLTMAAPRVRAGQGNTLPYLLKAVCDVHGHSGCADFARMHITGVTFYDHGPQYAEGYKLTNQSNRHSAEMNKEYALSWVRSTGARRQVSIDYPSCLD